MSINENSSSGVTVMTDEHDVNVLVTDVALIKNDIRQIEKSFDKLDSVLIQMTDILSKLAVQEAELRNNEKRIEILEKKFAKQNSDEVNFHKEFSKKMEDLKKDLQDKREERHEEIMKTMHLMQNSFENKIDAQDKRVSSLENWKWYVLGSVAIVIFIFTAFPWSIFFP